MERRPAALLVLIETGAWRWHVAAIEDQGQATPLLQSERGDLDEYRGLDFDRQVSFLRHRLAGALQRGCDRMYGRGLKANRFILLADLPFADTEPGVTQRLAEHFVEWMMNPPAVFLIGGDGFGERENLGGAAGPVSLDCLAGSLSEEDRSRVASVLPRLASQLDTPEQWERVSPPRPKKP